MDPWNCINILIRQLLSSALMSRCVPLRKGTRFYRFATQSRHQGGQMNFLILFALVFPGVLRSGL
jgi:hypothetical protein